MSTRLTKADLKGFDGEAQRLILDAQSKGATVRVSRRQHAIIRYGRLSASVPRQLKLQTRTAQNARAGVARLFRETC